VLELVVVFKLLLDEIEEFCGSTAKTLLETEKRPSISNARVIIL
jgi:hypothetical protein